MEVRIEQRDPIYIFCVVDLLFSITVIIVVQVAIQMAWAPIFCIVHNPLFVYWVLLQEKPVYEYSEFSIAIKIRPLKHYPYNDGGTNAFCT